MNNGKKRILPFMVAVMAACTSGDQNQPARAEHGLSVIRGKVEYIKPDNTPLPPARRPGQIVLRLSPVPGGLFGRPRTEPVYERRLDEPSSFELNLQEEGIKNHAEPLSGKWRKQGLTTKPETCRLVRLGTFAHGGEARRPIGPSSFLDADSRDPLMLLYVDGPCKISGSFTSNEKQHVHDINISRAGFHWVRLKQKDEHLYRLQRASPDIDIVFNVMSAAIRGR